MGYDYADENTSAWKLFKNEIFTVVEDYFGCMESVYNHRLNSYFRERIKYLDWLQSLSSVKLF